MRGGGGCLPFGDVPEVFSVCLNSGALRARCSAQTAHRHVFTGEKSGHGAPSQRVSVVADRLSVRTTGPAWTHNPLMSGGTSRRNDRPFMIVWVAYSDPLIQFIIG